MSEASTNELTGPDESHKPSWPGLIDGIEMDSGLQPAAETADTNTFNKRSLTLWLEVMFKYRLQRWTVDWCLNDCTLDFPHVDAGSCIIHHNDAQSVCASDSSPNKHRLNAWSAVVGSDGVLLQCHWSTEDLRDHYVEQGVCESQIMNHKDSFSSEPNFPRRVQKCWAPVSHSR